MSIVVTTPAGRPAMWSGDNVMLAKNFTETIALSRKSNSKGWGYTARVQATGTTVDLHTQNTDEARHRLLLLYDMMCDTMEETKTAAETAFTLLGR